jgi:hypothetical protein
MEEKIGMVLVGQVEGFELFEFPEHAKNGWRAFKLENGDYKWIDPKWKANWWFGWNGKRLARNRDTKRLRKDFPQIYRWVCAVLKED